MYGKSLYLPFSFMYVCVYVLTDFILKRERAGGGVEAPGKEKQTLC